MPTVVNNWKGVGKVVVWGNREKPSIKDIINIAAKEFPGVELSRLTVNDFFVLSDGPMFKEENKENRVARLRLVKR